MLGTPPVTNVMVIGGQSIAANEVNGRITFTESIREPFIRGNCNDDGIVNIADAVYILSALFQSGADPIDCPEGCDANKDGFNDSSDAVYILNYRFLQGPTPPSPFPNCGTEPGQEPEDCPPQNSCP
jgi:hypothetical protein